MPDTDNNNNNNNQNLIRPDYYVNSEYEVRKVARAWKLNFNLGSALKYIERHGNKPGESAIKDIRKAITFLTFELEALEEEKSKLAERVAQIKADSEALRNNLLGTPPCKILPTPQEMISEAIRMGAQKEKENKNSSYKLPLPEVTRDEEDGFF